MTYFSKLVIAFLLAFCCQVTLSAVNVKLEHLVVDVNEDSRLVKSGETMTLVWGDTLKLRSVLLRYGKQKDIDVNFIGFANHDEKRPENDIGYKIRTHRDLLANYSLKGKGREYEVRVSGKGFSESIYIRVRKPKFEYIELKVNGVDRTLQTGEVLRIAESDLFEVQRIKTNVGHLKDVKYSIVPFDQNEQSKIRFLEIRLYRFDSLFARIPVYMEKG
tara:strand:- start:1242 stop:1895 length:654 start_codon:yes stop_codon:yes gene_type:complete